jgi:hypothetical protein
MNPDRTRRPRLVLLGVVLAAGALLLTGPPPTQAVQELTGGSEPTTPVVALAALVAWGLVGWLGLLLAATLLSRLPGAGGSAGSRLARRLAPVAVRRGLELALGLTVTAGVLGAGPASAAGLSLVPQRASGAPVPSLDWGGAHPAPGLDWPATGSTARPGGPADVLDAPAPPSAPAPRGNGAVVIRPGDSLWRLAEQDLTRRHGSAPTAAQTAAAWPAWWAANRDVVGEDPDLLHPGAALDPPGEPAHGSPTPPDPAAPRGEP